MADGVEHSSTIDDDGMGYFDADGPSDSFGDGDASFDYFDAVIELDLLQQSGATESPSSSSVELEALAQGPEVDEDVGKRRNIVRGISGRVSNNRKRIHKLAREKRKLLQSQLRARRRKLRHMLSEPSVVVTMDKVSFVAGVLIIMIIEATLLLAPEKMGLLYTTLLLPLMVARYIIYRSDLYHYFMYDFCYFAQVLMLLHMYRYPDNQELGRALFSIANGPLAMAVVLWRNSLVFHSLDKKTSMFIHVLPPLVVFSQRWGEHLSRKEFPYYEEMEGTVSSNIVDFWVQPFGYYVLWQTLYLVKTEMISKRKLEYNTEIATSLRWMTRKKESASYKLLSMFGEQNQLQTFVALQAAFTLTTYLVAPLLWHSIWLHALYLGTIFVIALANGASYYFQVFAKRYIDEISKKVSEQNGQADAISMNAGSTHLSSAK
ncbi:hypothetical protein ACHAXT_001543 [Thalassiosira profunda]